MAILTIPNYAHIIRPSFRMDSNTLVFPGALRAGGQTIEIPNDLWRGEGTTMKLWGADAAAWRVFFGQLRGPGGRFYFGDPFHLTPRGPAGGAPLVAGAAQSGITLDIDNADPSVVGWLLLGDYFAIDMPSGHRELKLLTADADTDGAGAATLTFTPPLREVPADNAPVIVQNPTTIMQLVDDNQGGSQGALPNTDTFAFSAVEAVDIPD